MYFLIHHRFFNLWQTLLFSSKENFSEKKNNLQAEYKRIRSIWFILHIYIWLSFFLQNSMSFQKEIIYSAIQQKKQDKRRVFDSLSRRLMLNFARRPRINNCILQFVLGHFWALCSVYRATKSLFRGCFTNPRWKYDFFLMR